MLCTLINERDQEKQRAADLHVENLRLQLELERYRKWYYGPRADRLQSSAELAQMLLNFSEELDRKPINPDDVASRSEPAEELRRVKRRKGRRNLANFENLPVTTCVHELSKQERACPCCCISPSCSRIYPRCAKANCPTGSPTSGNTFRRLACLRST